MEVPGIKDIVPGMLYAHFRFSYIFNTLWHYRWHYERFVVIVDDDDQYLCDVSFILLHPQNEVGFLCHFNFHSFMPC